MLSASSSCIRSSSKHFSLKNLRGTPIFIKRDDLLEHQSASITGNKARKLGYLADAIATSKFPRRIASQGGLQSNALLALSTIFQRQQQYFDDDAGGEFTYYIKGEVPKWLSESPRGSYKSAIDAGVRIEALAPEEYQRLAQASSGTSGGASCSLSSRPTVSELLRSLSSSAASDDGDLTYTWIPQGGASSASRAGVSEMVDEILTEISRLVKEEQQQQLAKRPWLVLIASGTGTIAFHSHCRLRQLSSSVRVCALPCVGNADYLRRQMEGMRARFVAVADVGDDDDSLHDYYNADGTLPMILAPAKAARFAEPRQELYQIWKEINSLQCVEGGGEEEKDPVTFDLVYAPRAFEIIFEHLSSLSEEYNLIYYHCGGLEGNDSQLARYRRLEML